MAWLFFNLLDKATLVTDFQIKSRTRNKGAVLIRLLKLPSVYLITGTRKQQPQVVGAAVLWYPGERCSGAKSWVLMALLHGTVAVLALQILCPRKLLHPR